MATTYQAQHQEEEPDQEEREEMPKVIVADGSTKWLMGIVAAMLGGILIGWYNDVRELRPEVAVLKARMESLSTQVAETNHQISSLILVMQENNKLERASLERR